MGQPLFQLSDEFIGSVCYGMNDADVEARLVEALEAGRMVLRDGVHRSAASKWPSTLVDQIDVVIKDDGFMVSLPEEVSETLLSDEYGYAGDSPVPLLRQGVIRARIEAQRAISAVLEQR